MIIGAVVIIVLLLLLVYILASSVECKIVIHKSGEYERIAIFIRLFFGRIRWRYEWRSIRFVDWDEGFKIRVNKKDNVGTGHARKKKGRINKRIIHHYAENMSLLLHHTRDLMEWIGETLDKVQCNSLIWDTEIGLRNPATTGIVTGASWSAKSLFVGFLTRHIRFYRNPELDVIPHYNYPFFSTRLVCITKIRTAHAISVVLKLIIRIVRAEGGVRTWRNILSKA
ncbi:DUF2953 domain-containing protein [Paenibacillus sp. OSY-SE]|uniref:DUF2953 domain-containing protein n=1 Tax=Paenibacillus sp. OSY-SE TaxID=1196323 RepID=UPI0002F96177|nr:DUF2953 domain-containing protein [Paenibacillus sp. OSY-SE]